MIGIMEHDNLLTVFGDSTVRVKNAISAIKAGKGVLLVDDEDRENEGDLIFSAQTISEKDMACMIRHCSGIVCLCITQEKAEELNLPLMVEHNTSTYGTAFTISIEATEGVTTGVSAADRVKTIKAAIAEKATPQSLHSPGTRVPVNRLSGRSQETWRAYRGKRGTYEISRVPTLRGFV
ncbi:3,4-dihydroxy-2-butanone-4-phosphate synthase [Bacteroides cellulosilyticus]|uniref:3,4-dihydroxy-2-butanone-4-phosphate synthase n=1 Tax=Bacteroides cellulosilyticus TaxID=246787 RepID=UPI00189FE2A3